MVASRRHQLFRSQSGGEYNNYDNGDLESGNGGPHPSQPRQRFRDAIDATINRSRAQELKKQLLESVDHDTLEKFRKSDDEVWLTFAHILACGMHADRICS